jgi:hypothetical protein
VEYGVGSPHSFDRVEAVEGKGFGGVSPRFSTDLTAPTVTSSLVIERKRLRSQ